MRLVQAHTPPGRHPHPPAESACVPCHLRPKSTRGSCRAGGLESVPGEWQERVLPEGASRHQLSGLKQSPRQEGRRPAQGWVPARVGDAPQVAQQAPQRGDL